MITVRITHFYAEPRTPTKSVIYRTDYLPTLPVANYDGFLLDIIQLIESKQVVTYYSFFNNKEEIVASTSSFQAAATVQARNHIDPDANQVLGNPQRVLRTQTRLIGPPFTFDLDKHIYYRNTTTTDRTFTLQGLTFVSGIRD